MTIVYLLSNDPVSGPWIWSGNMNWSREQQKEKRSV